jgi:hypothetical protein
MGFKNIKFVLQACAWAVGLPLELMVISAMVRGPFRQFPLLFAYTIIDFLLTVAELPAYFAYYAKVPNADKWMSQWYWADEVIIQLLVYAVVMGFIYHATRMLSARAAIRTSLVAGALLFAGVSFIFHYNANLGRDVWMTRWMMDVSFCSAILDLALWMFLISARKKDQLVLLLSGALGIQFTGEAIGESVRNLAVHYHNSKTLSLCGTVLTTVADLACIYLWWQAFRAKNPVHPATVREAHRASR